MKPKRREKKRSKRGSVKEKKISPSKRERRKNCWLSSLNRKD